MKSEPKIAWKTHLYGANSQRQALIILRMGAYVGNPYVKGCRYLQLPRLRFPLADNVYEKLLKSGKIEIGDCGYNTPAAYLKGK